jgi:hypothetical protein
MTLKRPPTRANRTTDFVAGRQGSFRFRCTVTCGNLHPFMIGRNQVGQNALLWRGAVNGIGVDRWRLEGLEVNQTQGVSWKERLSGESDSRSQEV